MEQNSPNISISLSSSELLIKWAGEKEHEALVPLLRIFYDRIYKDPLIGYFFHPFDKEKLIQSQARFTWHLLGNQKKEYTPPSMQKTHQPFSITSGHFLRRHKILQEVLEKSDLPEEVRILWLKRDLALKDAIVNR